MEKSIRNADTVAQKLEPALTRRTNHKLETGREERWKNKKIVENRKAKAMATKWHNVRGEISLSNKKEDESDIGDDMDSDQANDKYPLQFWEGMWWKL